MNVVLEGSLSSRLTQHSQGGVEAVHVAVAVSPDLGPEQAGAGGKVEDAHLVIEAESHQGVSTLDVAVVVSNHHQIIVILLTPVVVELDCIDGVGIVDQHLLYLGLQLHRCGSVQVVREVAGQPLDHVQLPSSLVPLVSEHLVLHQGALARLDQAGQVLLEQSKLRGVFSLGRLHAPDHEPLGPEDSQCLKTTLLLGMKTFLSLADLRDVVG